MRLERYFEISQSEDVQSFRDRLVRFAHDMEFGIVSALLIVEPSPKTPKAQYISTTNAPEAWLNSYRNVATGARDPVLRRLRELSVPFVYDQQTYTADGAADLYEEQAPYGYKNGVAVAIHLPDKKHFMLGVDRDAELPRNHGRVIRLMADLQLLAVHAQSAAVRLLVPDEASPNQLPKLTAREIEVLQWTMQGKSAYAVGRLLGISDNTVNYHFRSIFRKLDASSKHQAVLKAISLGLIDPPQA